MNGAAVPPVPDPLPTRELLSLFTGLAEVTNRVLDSLDDERAADVPDLVEHRADLLARAAPLLQRLQLLQRRSGSVQGPEMRAALDAVRQAADGFQAMDLRLLEAMSRFRNDAAYELMRMERADAARVAYTRPSPPPPPAR